MEQRVSFETAKLLKKKGYPIGRKLVGVTYTQLGAIYTGGAMGAMCYEHYPAPKLTELHTWLLNNNFIYVNTYTDWVAWYCTISRPDYEDIQVRNHHKDKDFFGWRSEAFEAGLVQAVELLTTPT